MLYRYLKNIVYEVGCFGCLFLAHVVSLVEYSVELHSYTSRGQTTFGGAITAATLVEPTPLFAIKEITFTKSYPGGIRVRLGSGWKTPEVRTTPRNLIISSSV